MQLLAGVLFLLTVISGVQPAKWETLHARLDRVVDGDTLVVRGTDARHRRFRVRMIYIDAPELAQAFGANSTRGLRAKLVKEGPDLVLKVRATDNYGRKLAEVFAGPINVNLWLVSRGLAQCYKRRCPRTYKAVMRTARQKRLGIWNSPDHVAPWVWRKQHKNGNRL